MSPKNHPKMATNQAAKSKACGVFVGFFGGATNRSSEKVSSNMTVLELASRLTDISRYMVFVYIYDVIFRFIVYIQAQSRSNARLWHSEGQPGHTTTCTATLSIIVLPHLQATKPVRMV